MILQSRLPFDQISHPPSGPQAGAVAQSFRPCLEATAQLLQLGGLQAGFASGPTRFLEGFGSLAFPDSMPAADRLAVNTQSPGHFSLMETSLKKPGGFEPSLFQLIEIALDAFWITHARRLPEGIACVTILCERQ